MTKSKDPYKSPAPEGYAASWGEHFAVLMRKVPLDLFVGMITKVGLPTAEARELVDAFRRVKEGR